MIGIYQGNRRAARMSQKRLEHYRGKVLEVMRKVRDLPTSHEEMRELVDIPGYELSLVLGSLKQDGLIVAKRNPLRANQFNYFLTEYRGGYYAEQRTAPVNPAHDHQGIRR